MKTLIVKYAYRMTRVGQNIGINVFVFFLFFATIIVRLHADNPYMENSAGFCVSESDLRTLLPSLTVNEIKIFLIKFT